VVLRVVQGGHDLNAPVAAAREPSPAAGRVHDLPLELVDADDVERPVERQPGHVRELRVLVVPFLLDGPGMGGEDVPFLVGEHAAHRAASQVERLAAHRDVVLKLDQSVVLFDLKYFLEAEAKFAVHSRMTLNWSVRSSPTLKYWRSSSPTENRTVSASGPSQNFRAGITWRLSVLLLDAELVDIVAVELLLLLELLELLLALVRDSKVEEEERELELVSEAAVELLDLEDDDVRLATVELLLLLLELLDETEEREDEEELLLELDEEDSSSSAIAVGSASPLRKWSSPVVATLPRANGNASPLRK
jgi:hypothetical protein